jgi:hypothetical protein
MKWDNATIGEIARSLTVAQAWSLIATAVSTLAAVAVFAYWLGTKLGP